MKQRLLIFIEWFTPAYKAGGPIRAIDNLVWLTQDDFEIYIFTGDRDLGDVRAFDHIRLNEWITLNQNTNVYYADFHHQRNSNLQSVVKAVNPDVIYFNSMYAFRFFIRPLFTLRRLEYKGKIILAPRGMLKDSALKFKSVKKKLFLKIINRLLLLKSILFHATDLQEYHDIRKRLQVDAKRISIVPDVPFSAGQNIPIKKEGGSLNLIFVGRIHPIKGLNYVLDLLPQVRGKMNFKIAGWIEDKGYYNSCLEKIRKLPDSIQVDLLNDLPFEDLIQELKKAHFLILPTHGENFGHAIFESLAMGRPVIISDQTPWKTLEGNQVGWDVSLHEPSKFVIAIQQAMDMDQQIYDTWSHEAFQYAEQYLTSSNLKEKYQELFTTKRIGTDWHVHTGH